MERHEADAFAHTSLVERVTTAGLGFRRETDSRLTALERWQQRIIGGLMFGALLFGGGGIAAVVEFSRH